MIEENELINFTISIGLIFFIIVNYSKLKTLPAKKIILVGLSFLIIGWALTIIEGFFLGELFNLLEHICYTLSSILIAVWFFIVFKKKEDDQ